MTPLPTLRQLQFFLALVHRGSFSRAADDCLVSQSTLSSAIKELEAIFQCQLVDRSTRRFSLTPAGAEVAERAAPVLAMAEDMVRAVSGRRPLEGPFNLGVIPTIAPFLLPAAAPKIRKTFPDLELYLREEMTHALVERLATGALDAAILAFPYDAPGIDWIALGEDPFLVAGAPEHPVMNKSRINMADLKSAPLLLLEDGHCLREHALDACRLRDEEVSGAYAATSLFTLTQMVKAGLGVTLLPKLAIDAGLAKDSGLVAKPLSGSAPARTIGIAWRKGSGRREDCELLADLLRRQLKG